MDRTDIAVNKFNDHIVVQVMMISLITWINILRR